MFKRSSVLALILLVPVLANANLLTNGSFEVPATGNDFTNSGWIGEGESGRHMWAAHDGAYGAAMQGWAGPHTGRFYQVVTATNGTYTFAIWVRAETGHTAQVNSLKLKWYDAGDVSIQAETVVSYTNLPNDDLWHHLYVTGTCTSQDLAKVGVEFEGSFGAPAPGGTAMFVDDADLYRGAFVRDVLANCSFERPDNGEDWNWRASKWRAGPKGYVDDVALSWENWMNRSGEWLASLKGDRNATATNYITTIQQGLVCPTGTYTFAVWIQRQNNFALSNAELRIEWYDRTFTNKVQDDTTTALTVPADWQWHEYWVTGTCSVESLYEARAVMYYKWAYVTNDGGYDLVMDDAHFMNGTYTGRSVNIDWAYFGEPNSDPRIENVPGTNNFGTFMQVNPVSGTNTTYVLADSPEFSKYEGEQGSVGLRTAWQNYGTGVWVETFRPMTRVTQVELSSADPFHGLPSAGVKTVDVWSCRWAQPQGGTNSFPVYFAPYLVTTAGVAQSTRVYLVNRNASATNNFGQLCHSDYGGSDYYYQRLPAGFHTALSNGTFEAPLVENLADTRWQYWGEIGRATNWCVRTGNYGGNFPSWDPGGGGVYQDIATAGGTYTFSIWYRRQSGAHPTSTIVRLEWYGSNGLVQTDSRSYAPVPADGSWYNLFISGTCTDASLVAVRPMLYSRFTDGTEAYNEGSMFDDAEFYSGSYTGGFGAFTNGGFDTVGGSEYQADRWLPSNADRAGREPWAGKAPSAWGGAFRGWDTNFPAYTVTLSQWADVTPGPYTFTAWMRQEPGFWDTNVEMRIEWYDAGLNKLQVDSVAVLDVTNNDVWVEHSVSGTCSDPDLFAARVVFFAQWDRNTNEVGRSMKIDDVTFVALVQPDEDGDGMPDWWELKHFNGTTNANASDYSDADPTTDGEEWVFDTDPTNGASFYHNTITNAGAAGDIMQFIINAPTSTQRWYDVWWRTDLLDNNDWTPVGLNVPGLGPAQQVVLTVTNEADDRIYRTGVKVPSY